MQPQDPDTPLEGDNRRFRPNRSTAAASVAFVVICIVWGSTWLAIKVGYQGMGALTGASLRFAISSLVLMTAMVGLRLPFPEGRDQWSLAILIGLLEFTVSYGLVYWGEQFLDSGLTAVLFATLPFLTGIVGHVGFSQRLTVRFAGGMIVGLFGLVVVFWGSLHFDPGKVFPMLSVVLSALFAALVILTVPRWGADLHPATYTGPAMGIGSLGLGVTATLVAEPLALPQTILAWAALLYLALFGSAGAFLVYFWLVRKRGPRPASVVHFVTPLIALVLGVLLLGERPGLEALLGASIVFVGVLVTITEPQSAGDRSRTAALETRPEPSTQTRTKL